MPRQIIFYVWENSKFRIVTLDLSSYDMWVLDALPVSQITRKREDCQCWWAFEQAYITLSGSEDHDQLICQVRWQRTSYVSWWSILGLITYLASFNEPIKSKGLHWLHLGYLSNRCRTNASSSFHRCANSRQHSYQKLYKGLQFPDQFSIPKFISCYSTTTNTNHFDL